MRFRNISAIIRIPLVGFGAEFLACLVRGDTVRCIFQGARYCLVALGTAICPLGKFPVRYRLSISSESVRRCHSFLNSSEASSPYG
jgi:hypothetical protein